MDKRVPLVIQPLIESYTVQLSECLPGILNSFYMVGSIALGEFNPLYSDIDFVALVTRSMTAQEIQVLRELHRSLEQCFPRWKMSGCYIRSEDLGNFASNIAMHLHYHDGVLHIQRQNELNAVTWWELKNHAFTVFGTPPQHLHISIDWNALVVWMLSNLNTYWAAWTRSPVRILMLHSDWGVQWAVTGVLRQFYSFREHTITTKVKAAEYALYHLPKRWHRLIQEAINIRNGGQKSAYRFKILRTFETVYFLRFMIQLCNIQYTRQ
jgi:hypothetical protein